MTDAKRAKLSESSPSGDTVGAMLCGTGEYTTGYVHNTGSKSDKKVGVVGLVMFELRRLGHVHDIGLVGTTGKKFVGIRKHLQEKITEKYGGLDTSARTFPADDVARDTQAYKQALDTMKRGDVCTIFTPDDTHYDIAKYAIERGLHVLLTKPAVMTLARHRDLMSLARTHNVLVMVEFHKRWDPIYTDARARARALGDFMYFDAFMSQPKFQLETFKAWAGKSSDISYYLNSHHIDVHCWSMEGRGAPVSVTALGTTGVADAEPFNCPKGTEDTITLLTKWINKPSGNVGTAVYTASWAAPKADVHSQQRFHMMCHGGEIVADQAHRGYTACTHEEGLASVNPLYMAYMPGVDGGFNGHHGYGYKSIESFVKASIACNKGERTPESFDGILPTLHSTCTVTAILEAGRRSLDAGGKTIKIVTHEDGSLTLED